MHPQFLCAVPDGVAHACIAHPRATASAAGPPSAGPSQLPHTPSRRGVHHRTRPRPPHTCPYHASMPQLRAPDTPQCAPPLAGPEASRHGIVAAPLSGPRAATQCASFALPGRPGYSSLASRPAGHRLAVPCWNAASRTTHCHPRIEITSSSRSHRDHLGERGSCPEAAAHFPTCSATTRRQAGRHPKPSFEARPPRQPFDQRRALPLSPSRRDLAVRHRPAVPPHSRPPRPHTGSLMLWTRRPRCSSVPAPPS